MKEELFHDAIGALDEDLLEETAQLRKKTKAHHTAVYRWCALAACLTIVLTGLILIRHQDGKSNGSGNAVSDGTTSEQNHLTAGGVPSLGLPQKVDHYGQICDSVPPSDAAEGNITGFCGNTQTTVFFRGTDLSHTFMFDNSAKLTEILVNLKFSKGAECDCIAEYNVETEFGNYEVSLKEGYARSTDGQAELTQEQIQTMQEIFDWAIAEAKKEE